VKEGDAVSAGELLVQIRNSESLTNGIELSGELINQTRIQLTAIQEQYTALKSFHETSLANLRSEIANLSNSKSVIGNTLETNRKKVELAKEQYFRSLKLFNEGHLSSANLAVTEQAFLDSQSNLNASERLKLQIEIDIDKLRSQLRQLPKSQAVELSNLAIKQSELEVQLLQLENQFEFVIKAPEAGYITGIRVNSGSRIVNDRPLLSIIPADTDLLIELLLPSRSIGFIETGDQVNIRFDAFPYQKFGFQSATITHIDDAVLLPNDISSPLPLNSAAYRIQATLDKQTVEAYGKEFSLKPGMLAQADIVLEERTILEWLLEPIYSIKGTL
jgi:membrane fusion protein